MAVSFPQGLLDAFETAQHSIFRLETLPYYAGDPNFDRFLAGEPWQDTESKRSWCDLVRRRTVEGVSMQRVHVVTEPLSDYLRFELSWSYPPNVEAGEDIRVLVGSAEALPRARDFWLFDDTQAWWMDYDQQGQLTGVWCGASWSTTRSTARLASVLSRPLAEYMAPA